MIIIILMITTAIMMMITTTTTTTTTIIMMIILLLMMIMIIIALKGTNRDLFKTISSPRSELSPTRMLVFRAKFCADNVQHIERLWRAICHVPRGTI